MEGWKDKNANEKVVKNLELLIILSNFAPNNIETMEDKRREELNARINEAEGFITQAEKGDWRNWVTEEQSRANLYSKYPWLR